MPAHLIRKLEHFTLLSEAEKAALTRAAGAKLRRMDRGEDVLRGGDRPQHVNVVLEGWLCRYKTLPDGRRSIAALLLPGDVCDMRMFILRELDHSISAVSAALVAQIPTETILDLIDAHPRLNQALWWNSLVEEATAREWTVNLGRRDAYERVAHLLCEIFFRLRSVGMTKGTSCDLPLTQADLADTTGLSTVHVNRTLQELRANNLIVLSSKTLTVPDLDALCAAAAFNANYLHLGRDGSSLDANA